MNPRCFDGIIMFVLVLHPSILLTTLKEVLLAKQVRLNTQAKSNKVDPGSILQIQVPRSVLDQENTTKLTPLNTT